MFSHKKLLVALLLACNLSVFSEETKPIKLYGFARSDFFSDTRDMYTSVQDLFSFYPMYKDLNVDGEDLNAIPSSSMMSIASRFGLDISAPAGFWGAKSAFEKIETDFGGSPNYMLLRIRQAYTQLLWDKSNLLIGQTWHPLFVPATMPNVLSLNAGSPFQPFNRSPQIRFNYQKGKINLSAAAIYQMMYTNHGPEGASSSYQKNAITPELYVSIEYKKNNSLVGLGADYKSIMPTRYKKDLNGVSHVNHDVLRTPALMVYGVTTSGNFTAKAKVIVGQNLTEHCIIGGYAITPKDEYIPYNSLTSYIHFNYGKIHQLGLMLGYTENFGPSKSLPIGSKFYGFGVANMNADNERMINNIFRIVPTYSYNIKNWRLGVELEYTNAGWGKRSNDNGTIMKLDRSDNYRIYAILMYTF